jgi:hypothetical protein
MTATKAKTITTEKPKPTPRKPVQVPAVDSLPANPFCFEVLTLVSKQKTTAKKVEVLQRYSDSSLKAILIWNFDESIISAVPKGIVPYSSVGEQGSFMGTLSEKIDDAVDKMKEMGSRSLGATDQGRSSIRKEYSKFYNFIKGGNDGLSSLRRETMFINVLEGLHPLEAEILCLVKDKNLETKYKVTKEIVSAAYPDIIWGGRS